MPDIVLYQFAADVGAESASPFCVKVHRALAYKRLPYRVIDIGSPGQLRRVNPAARKLPVLEYDGELVQDSTDILRHLERHHPAPALWPTEPYALAQVQLLEDWADESLYWVAVYQRWAIDTNFQPFARRTFGSLPPPIRWVVPGLLRSKALKQLRGQGIGRGDSDSVSRRLAGHLEMLAKLLAPTGWLAGTQLTAADLAAFGPLRGMALPTHPESAALIAAVPEVVQWLGRLDQATTGDHTVAVQ